ncbi:hypothetical protein OS493_001240 [Desmophyllum pertusum]|uniref:Synaptonemal complex protein 2 Spt16M-like domain-containing protein n=1 Tax=Desmophyllum pertusum TaxID=174260 RepID=A0A9W9ZUV6_9CNID|nr:hypothetical protein OS493_001240 [Desmophyllum pertusum]
MLYNIDSSDFELCYCYIFYFPKVLDTIVDHGVVCTPDAVETLLSFFEFLTAICEKSSSGKEKLVLIVPVLIRDIIVNQERVIHLRIEAVRLTNMILGDVLKDKVDPTDSVSLAFKELEDNMEHLLVTAGDIELQAGMVEIIFRLIPCAVRHERAQEYFSTNSASQAFSDITSPEFEAGCRNFLNTLNQSQKEKQSVVSIPCYSASFGRTEVHQPRDEKIQDFWVDFNFGSKSISLFVEEKDREGNYKEGSSWETVLIKAEYVEDHRLKETKNDEVALLLKLKHAASDLVTFCTS